MGFLSACVRACVRACVHACDTVVFSKQVKSSEFKKKINVIINRTDDTFIRTHV